VVEKGVKAYKLTLAIQKFPIHSIYYSYVLEYWTKSKEKIDYMIEELKNELVSYAEKEIGYSSEEIVMSWGIDLRDAINESIDIDYVNRDRLEEWETHTEVEH
jgi:hypothetical protein